MKVVLFPLAVCAGEKEPQLGALPQIATQSTPAFATSLRTVADTGTLPPTLRDEGGDCIIVTEMIGVAGRVELVEQAGKPKQETRAVTGIRKILR